MNEVPTTMAIDVEEIDRSSVFLSEKKTRTWNWKEDGQPKSRSQDYAEVYYGEKGNKLTFVVSDVRTVNGVQTSTKFKTGFMSINLSNEQSSVIRKKLDDCLFELCFKSRLEMMPKKGSRINHPSEMRMMFQGIVKDGGEKCDGSDERWQDQITCTVPTKRNGKQVVVDTNLCNVEDLDGNVYAWSALDQKKLKEYAVEIDRIVFDKEITVRGVVRLIVTDSKTVPRVVTKRKITQGSPLQDDTSMPLSAKTAKYSSGPTYEGNTAEGTPFSRSLPTASIAE